MTHITDLDFDILDENWTRYILADDVILRVRIGLLKLQGDLEQGPPRVQISAHNLVAVTVPESLLRPKKEAPIQNGEITQTQLTTGRL
jgi:hypothetical protein